MIFRPLLVAVMLLGCKSGDLGNSATPRPPDLQMVSAGNEPRRVLRYHAPKGTKTGLDIAVDMELIADEMGGPMPTIVMSMQLSVDDALADGRMKLHATILDVTARERPQSTVPAEALTSSLETMKGLVINSMLSPTGRLTGTEIDRAGKQLPDVANAQLASLTSSFETVMMPLPEEAVGVGAVWRNSKPIEQTGMKMKTVNAVTVTAIAGDQVSFTIETEVHGDDQTVTQGGVSIDVKDIIGTGTAKGTLELKTLAMTSELTTEFRSDMLAAGETKPTQLRMSMTTKVTPR